MINSIRDKILLFSAILLSLIFVVFATPYIFLANSPRINPKFVSDLKNLPNTIVRAPRKILLALTGQKDIIKTAPMIDLSKIPVQQVSKGVYAGEIKNNLKYFKIVDFEVEWATMDLRTKSGKVVTFQYPKGNPPAKEMLDVIKGE